MVRLRFSMLSLALIGGCAGGSQDTTLEIVNDVCEPTTIIAPADATDEQLASIDGAIAMWTRLGFDHIARGDGTALGGTQQIPIVAPVRNKQREFRNEGQGACDGALAEALAAALKKR